MRTSLSSDPVRGAGHAIIRLETGNIAVPSMPEGCTFSLQRASDALFLTPHGWQESHSSQIPDSIATQGDLLELYVGPQVVDNLDVLDTYRIQLQHTALPASVLYVESLNYSPLKGKEGLATAGKAVPEVPAPPLENIAPPEVTPEPELAPELVTESPPQEDLIPLTMTQTDNTPHESKKSPLLWIVPLLLLLAAGGGYYWYSQQQPAPDSTPNSAPEAAAPATTGKDAEKTADKSPEKAPEVVHPLAQARKQLQGNADAAQNLALARSLQQQKFTDPALLAQSADAVFLLVEDAAQKGSAESMLLLGNYFDPANTAPKGSIQPDARQALHWYTQARAGGQGEAADKALNALRLWAEAAAAGGDTKAQEILALLPAK